MSATQDHCAEPRNTLLSVEQGRQRILDAIQPIETHERLSIHAALGRVLAHHVVSAIDVPPFANSAMDGYAVRSSVCQVAAAQLTVIGSCFAGAPFAGEINDKECVRIMTGAVLPSGADAVIMQEHVQREDDTVTLRETGVEPGENVRYAGEDTRRGDTILGPGTRLGPAEIGLLASVGVPEVWVVRRLRVAFFSTGDELTGPGKPLAPGQIYDCNRYTLHAMLTQAGLECHDLGVIPDERDAVRAAFRQASESADLVLTSGGVSVGEADFVTQTLAELGEVNFWRMAMKPGKPLAFGRVGSAYFFGLPGNPVSVMATFYQFVLPAIHKLCGEPLREPFLIEARASDAFRKAPGRMEFQRGVLTRNSDGKWSVASTGLQGSHVLSSMSRANCFVLLPAESEGVEPGELVEVQPFSSFV